jgi:hypothetical protein
MKINKRYRPELLVSRGKGANPLLTDPWLDAKDRRLLATDGHALVALPVETERTERSRYLACSLLKAARVLGEKDLPAEIHDQEVVEFGVLWPTAQERTFPDWKKLVPKARAGSPGTATLALNADLLARLANSMGFAGVRLTIQLGAPDDQPGPILVQPLDDLSEEFGLLMPLGSASSAEDALDDAQKCPVCARLLAAGAACPTHGDPKESRWKLLEAEADELLKNAGAGELAKKELKGPAEKFVKRGGRRG